MRSYGAAYIPARINYARCQKYKCPLKEIFTNSTRDSTATTKFIHAGLLKRAVNGGSGSKGKIIRYNNKLNAYGQYSGALGGYGAAPKNKF